MRSLTDELHVMDVWVFRMAEADEARSLYDALPPALRSGAELRCALTGAEMRTPSEAAAEWVRVRLRAA